MITGGASYSFLGGGLANQVHSHYSVALGGDSNVVWPSTATIAGGYHNILWGFAQYSFLGDGAYNSAQDTFNVVIGGLRNNIDSGSEYSAIVGGDSNYIGRVSSSSVLAGGKGNQIHSLGKTDTGSVCLISLGSIFTPGYDVLAGGLNNNVFSTLGSLIGGVNNKIDTNGGSSVLSGGDSNYVGAGIASLGGGYHNVILPKAYGGTIPGGVGLIAGSSGQFVAGTYNVQDTTTGPNGMLAIFGNGMEDTLRSTAFTISKKGHTWVAQDNGPGGATLYSPANPAIYGASYRDNSVVAWGDMDTGTIDSHLQLFAHHDFGVSGLSHRIGPGYYEITLNTVDTNNVPLNLSGCSITATITAQDSDNILSGPPCLIVMVSAIDQFPNMMANSFYVWIKNPSGCGLEDHRFMFKVCGRK